MSKKRNRQPDANEVLSDCSTDSCDNPSATGGKCPHVPKAVNFNKIKKYINTVGIISECSDCKKEKVTFLKDLMSVLAKENVVPPHIWICLQCGHQGCGREDSAHALEHFKKPFSDCHFMVVDSLHWSVWCYQCEMKVNIDCRKKLQETVEFIKKAATVTRNQPQTELALKQCQKDIINSDTQKEKNFNKLPVVGLTNLGNTCFFNAVMQCLAQTPYLVQVLDDLRLPGQKFVLPGGKHKFPNSSEEVEVPLIEGTLEGWGSFTSILCKTLVEMQNSSGRQTYCPAELLNSFKKKSMQCMDGGQHDSHELLRHLLEIVRNEDLRRYQSVILKEVGLNEKTNPDDVEDGLKSRVKFYGNQANAKLLGPDLIFRGILVSTVQCLDCHHSSRNTESFLDLSLPVTVDKPQPPILKRKNSGFEDNFVESGFKFNDTGACSEFVMLKEKIPAQKNWRSKKHEMRDNGDAVTNRSNIIEENNSSILESEGSHTDIEDNVEPEGLLPEVGESDYSSEKQSALASPSSPSTDLVDSNKTGNELLLDNYWKSSPLNNPPPLEDTPNMNSSHSSSPTDASATNISQEKPVDRLDNSESPENETRNRTGFSLFTLLAEDSDLTSPEGPTVSLSSATSKESPTSPLLAITDGKQLGKFVKPLATKQRYKLNLTKQESSIGNRGKSIEKEKEHSKETCNGINGITSEISKMGINGNLQRSPARYITKEGECSVQSCLKQFTSIELMSGSNKVGCEACTARERKIKENCNMVCTLSKKQYLINRVPAVLILHLKRFQAHRIDFRKVTKHVSFPTILDLGPICTYNKKSRIYALYGVVEHSGTIHGGHYIAYVKSRRPLASDDPRWSFLPSRDIKDTEKSSSSPNSDSETEEATAPLPSTVKPPPGKWYHVSDSRVTEVDEQTVLESQAYLLFYERIL